MADKASYTFDSGGDRIPQKQVEITSGMYAPGVAAYSPPFPTGGSFAGQVTVATAGSPVQGPNLAWNAFWLKGHPSNTSTIWVGGSTAGSATGFPLAAGETILVPVTNLNQLWFDSSGSSQAVCWLRA